VIKSLETESQNRRHNNAHMAAKFTETFFGDCNLGLRNDAVVYRYPKFREPSFEIGDEQCRYGFKGRHL